MLGGKRLNVIVLFVYTLKFGCFDRRTHFP